MTADRAIIARDLEKRYTQRKQAHVRALDGLTLEVDRGDWVALLGPNGSGKSTLLKCITRSVQPDAGELRVLGVGPDEDAKAVRTKLSVVFQTPGLDRLLTVRENLMLQCALFGWAGQHARERVQKHAETLSLTERLDHRVGTLSGGLARRTDLARALLSEPDLLLLDEPTTGLDPEARASFLDLIERTKRERPTMTVLMSTHLMDEADRCDSVALLASGKVLTHQTPGALRAGFGDLALRSGKEHAQLMRDAGLDVLIDGDHAIGAGSTESRAGAAQSLALAGASFRLEPPNLEDVYLALSSQEERA